MIVLCWKSADRIGACLESLQRQTFTDFELIVIDNSSTDGSLAVVRALWPSATILQQTTNTGFTGGVNRGLRYMLKGPAEFAWQLNDDTEFGPRVLGELVARADEPDRPGLVSPYLVDADGRVVFGPDGPYPPARGRPGARPRRVRPETALFLPGTALLIRREVIERIGLLDPRYFFYCDDDDFCLRADDAGFDAAYCDRAVVRHAFEPRIRARGAAAIYFRLRNKLLFQRTYAPIGAWPRFSVRTVSAAIRQATRHRARGEGAFAEAALAGAWDGLLGRTGGPYDPERLMPRWLARVLMARRGFLGEALRGRFRTAVRRAAGGRARTTVRR